MDEASREPQGGAPVRSGGCLCGAVRYRVTGPLRDVLLCHCEICRRTSGHYVAATRARRADVSFGRVEGLRWYESSPGIHRGFCAVCGSSVFWQPRDRETLGIMAGSLDVPTGLRSVGQINVEAASDYYCIPPGVEVDPPVSPGAGARDPHASEDSGEKR